MTSMGCVQSYYKEWRTVKGSSRFSNDLEVFGKKAQGREEMFFKVGRDKLYMLTMSLQKPYREMCGFRHMEGVPNMQFYTCYSRLRGGHVGMLWILRCSRKSHDISHFDSQNGWQKKQKILSKWSVATTKGFPRRLPYSVLFFGT